MHSQMIEYNGEAAQENAGVSKQAIIASITKVIRNVVALGVAGLILIGAGGALDRMILRHLEENVAADKIADWFAFYDPFHALVVISTSLIAIALARWIAGRNSPADFIVLLQAAFQIIDALTRLPWRFF